MGHAAFIRHAVFDAWLRHLLDMKGKARILARIKSAEHGNFGDCESVGDGVSEMRVHVGPGYRVYFTRQGQVVYVFLCGGDKSSQKRDIQRAKALAREFEEDE
jgi:putative addiction module killer protein